MANPELSALIDKIKEHVPIPARMDKYDDGSATPWRLALAESAIQFASLGREIGLEIPWDVPPSIFDQAPDHVPFIDQSLLALAQHHGIPTQLLDWSYDPLTAAYFAATGTQSEDDLCVWALEMSKIEQSDRIVPNLTLSRTAENPNLRAQAGCFLTYAQGPDQSSIFQYYGGRWPGFERSENLKNAFQKFVLVGSQRADLVALLLREGRSKAHLMPSWESVATTLLESWKAPMR